MCSPGDESGPHGGMIQAANPSHAKYGAHPAIVSKQAAPRPWARSGLGSRRSAPTADCVFLSSRLSDSGNVPARTAFRQPLPHGSLSVISPRFPRGLMYQLFGEPSQGSSRRPCQGVPCLVLPFKRHLHCANLTQQRTRGTRACTLLIYSQGDFSTLLHFRWYLHSPTAQAPSKSTVFSSYPPSRWALGSLRQPLRVVGYYLIPL